MFLTLVLLLCINVELMERKVADTQRTLPVWTDVTVETVCDDYDHYKHFMDEYAPKLVPKSIYNRHVTTCAPELWLHPVLEAFGHLTIENYREKVDQWVNHRKDVEARWTGKRENAKKNQGYSNEGIQRHHDIMDKVAEGRQSDTRKGFGSRYLEEKIEEAEYRMGKGKKRKQEAVDRRERGRIRSREVGLDLAWEAGMTEAVLPVTRVVPRSEGVEGVEQGIEVDDVGDVEGV